MHRHRQTHGRLIPTRTILPGELLCAAQPQLLGTILGSCVAVCLYDRRAQVGGMCHFLLPKRPANAEDAPRFGDTAVPALLQGMFDLGAGMRTIEAKLFGGASVLHTGYPEYAVGRRNIEVAVAELRHRRVPIVSSYLSGTRGLLLRQCTACGDVWVRPVGGHGRRGHGSHAVHELPWLSDDLNAAMVIQGSDGLPVAIRHRWTIERPAHCGHCSGAENGEAAAIRRHG